MKPRSRLFRKYAVRFMALVGGALLVSGLLDLYFSFRENQVALVRLQQAHADAAAARIAQFFRTIEDQLGWATKAMDIPLGPSPDRRALDVLLQLAPSITEVRYLDAAAKEGLYVSRVERDVVGSQAEYAVSPLVLQARAGATAFGPVEFRHESEPYLTIARAGPGPDAGVLLAAVNLKFVWEVVSQIQVGRAGYAYVVDGHGILVGHPDMSSVLRKTDLASLPQVQAVVFPGTRDHPAPSDETIGRDREGRAVLTAHAAIAPLGWWVFVDAPTADAMAPAYAALLRTAVLLLIGLGLSAIASLLLAARITRPIEALQVGAARIGQGALDQRIEVRTGDELEGLATQFNHMAAHLQDSYAGLEAKIAERTRQLETVSRHKSQFLANMSHEFRTPMNAIIGFSEVLLNPALPVTDAERRQFLQDILASGRHLLALINEILDLAKVEAGRLELRRVPARLAEVLDSVQHTMRPLATAKGVRLAMDREELPALVLLDPARIKQALLNLVGNAVKFTPKNGQVWVRAGIAEEAIRIEVQDTGPGIPKAEHDRIFQEFEQATPALSADRPEGTGLGLTLARRFIELHGGRLWVESEVGQGSTFIVTLPLTPSPGGP